MISSVILVLFTIIIIIYFKSHKNEFYGNYKSQISSKSFVTKNDLLQSNHHIDHSTRNEGQIQINSKNTNQNTTQNIHQNTTQNNFDNLPNYLINGYSTKWSDILKIKNGCHGNNCVNDWSGFPSNEKPYFDNKNYCSFNEPYWREPVSSTSFNVCNQIKLDKYQLNHNQINNYSDYYDHLKIGSFIDDYQPIIN